GDPRGDGARGQAAGLGVPDHPAHAAAQLEADLGDLGGLPGAGLARDDHDLVVADSGGDVLPAGADGELGRVGDRGGPSGGDALLGGVDGGGDGRERCVASLAAGTGGGGEAGGEAGLVDE